MKVVERCAKSVVPHEVSETAFLSKFLRGYCALNTNKLGGRRFKISEAAGVVVGDVGGCCLAVSFQRTIAENRGDALAPSRAE